MIRTESEYRKTLERLEQNKTQIRSQRQHLEAQGFSTDQTERVLQPLLSFQAQLEEEIEIYDRLRRGELPTLYSLSDIGQWLIGVRISQGLSQKELAGRLNVSEQQISRDERNEYHGITVDRAEQILQTMGVQYRLEDDTSGQPAFTETKAVIARASPPQTPEMPPLSLPDQVAVYLRADRKLKPENAVQLAEIFRLAYQAMAGETSERTAPKV
jgi:transcriptional regulator with XRE-family HTH domain